MKVTITSIMHVKLSHNSDHSVIKKSETTQYSIVKHLTSPKKIASSNKKKEMQHAISVVKVEICPAFCPKRLPNKLPLRKPTIGKTSKTSNIALN